MRSYYPSARATDARMGFVFFLKKRWEINSFFSIAMSQPVRRKSSGRREREKDTEPNCGTFQPLRPDQNTLEKPLRSERESERLNPIDGFRAI